MQLTGADAESRLRAALGEGVHTNATWRRYCEVVSAVLNATSLDDQLRFQRRLSSLLDTPLKRELHREYFVSIVTKAVTAAKAQRDNRLRASIPTGLFTCGVPVNVALMWTGLVDNIDTADSIRIALWAGFTANQRTFPPSV